MSLTYHLMILFQFRYKYTKIDNFKKIQSITKKSIKKSVNKISLTFFILLLLNDFLCYMYG